MKIKQLSIVLIFLFKFFVAQGIMGEKPNIILIQADDLGWDDLAIHGNQFVETPVIDKLAKDGIRFNRFYLNAVCAPTRASLLTGRHFLRTGVSHVHGGKDFVNLNEVLLSEGLKLNGYRTGMWGKWHSGKTTGYFPWERGFDEAYMAQLYKHENSAGELNGKKVQHDKWASEVIVDYAIDFMDKSKDEPFFAYLSFLTVHAPLRAPENLVKKYTGKGLSENLATLYGMIDQLDSCLNVLFLALEERELTDNTIVLFISDNGPAYNGGSLTDEDREIRNHSHFKGHKGNLWENGVKSPLFVKWPAKIKPGIDSRLISITDLYPTLIEIAGGKYPDKQLPLDGKSFKSYLEGASGTDEKFVYDYVDLGWANHSRPYSPKGIPGEYDPKEKNETGYPVNEQLISVRKGPFKLMQNPFPVKGVQFRDYKYILVNIENDPLEERDLKEEDPEIFDELKDKLDSWFRDILNEDHSLISPQFIVDSTNSTVLAYSPREISAGLTNTAFYLTGWENDNQRATYAVDIKIEGVYRLMVNYSKVAAPFELTAFIGDQSVKCMIEEPGETSVGTFKLNRKTEKLILTNTLQKRSVNQGETQLNSIQLSFD